MKKDKAKKIRKIKLTTIISQNSKFVGDLFFSGGLHVDGMIEGNITCRNEEDVLILSEHGVIHGEIKVQNIIINGNVKGDIHAGDYIELAPKANIHGNVHYCLLEMCVGAEINGNLVHCAELPLNQRTKTKKLTPNTKVIKHKEKDYHA